jgi:hypothetical protein
MLFRTIVTTSIFAALILNAAALLQSVEVWSEATRLNFQSAFLVKQQTNGLLAEERPMLSQGLAMEGHDDCTSRSKTQLREESNARRRRQPNPAARRG